MAADDRPAVRPATPDDAPGIAAMREVVAAEGRWLGREAPLPPAFADQVRAAIDAGDGLHLVAELDGEVVGDGGLHRDGHGRAGVFMSLLPAQRGRGLGGDLLDACLAWARQQPDLHKLELEVWPHNERALRLYRSRGFVVEGYRHRHWRRANGELWDSIEMGLLLVEDR